MNTTTQTKMSAIILAGGKATRMGGIDKGLIPLAGRPMISHVIDRVAPQVDELFINANREIANYAQFNHPILSDQHAGFIGPLAGFQLGLKHAKHDLVLMVPCDAPLIEPSLAQSLLASMQSSDADIAVAKSDGHVHPVFCLCKKSVLTSLEAYIESGERKVNLWQKSQRYVEVNLSQPNADGVTESFINVNTSEILSEVAAQLGETQSAPAHASKQVATATDSPADTLSKMADEPDCMDDYDPNSLSVSAAKQYIEQFLSPVEQTETIPLLEGLGRVLAADIIAPANVPNYDNSAMDGYAFHSSALNNDPIELTIKSTILAGQTDEISIAPNECARIMTGGMMPKGADTVIMQERTTTTDSAMRITEPPKPKANVRYAGEDMQQGQVVLGKGHLLKPADIGLIASLGLAELSVFRTLAVAIFSTGDELVQLGQPLAQGQVYDSNRYTIISMLQRLGVKVIDKGAIPDDPKVLESTLLTAAKEADVVITSGGVSVGEADYMKQLLQTHGKVLFWKLAMKPGRPLAYGKLLTAESSAHYFGLPGNPVAVMVTFYQFVRDALQHLMGQTKALPMPTFEVRTSVDLKKMPGRTEFQRGICYQDDAGEWLVKTTGAQSSAMLSSMSQANCFIILPEATGHLAAGSMVTIQLFDGVV